MEYSDRARVFLTAHGMEPERFPLRDATAAFIGEMELGLAGQKSSRDMIPTWLSAGTIEPGRRAAVIDAGGTNFRAGSVLFTEEGAVIERCVRSAMPGTSRSATWDEFEDFAAGQIAPMLEGAEGIGFCFSYRATITPERDGEVIRMSKGVDLRGYEGRYICADLKAALARRGAPDVPAVLVNDTAAVLLAGAGDVRAHGYDGLVGLICGTGQNTCCVVDTGKIGKLGLPAGGNMLVNLESGCFDGWPQGDYDRELDANTNNPRDHLLEKMTSGAYLGELCRLTLRGAARDGLFSPTGADTALSLATLTSAEADAMACGAPGPFADEADAALAGELCLAIFDRAARCVCANLSAILVLTDCGADAAHPACVSADGSVIRFSRAFRGNLEARLTDFTAGVLGRHCVIRTQEEATTLGSAAAALLNLK